MFNCLVWRAAACRHLGWSPESPPTRQGEVPKVDALKLIILSNPRNSCWPAPIIYWGSGINIWAKFFTLWHWYMKRSCWIQSHQFKVANAMKYPAPAHWLWPNLANINCFVFKLCQAGPSPAQQRKLYIWHQPQWNKFCQKNGFDTFPFNVGARRRGRCGGHERFYPEQNSFMVLTEALKHLHPDWGATPHTHNKCSWLNETFRKETKLKTLFFPFPAVPCLKNNS